MDSFYLFRLEYFRQFDRKKSFGEIWIWIVNLHHCYVGFEACHRLIPLRNSKLPYDPTFWESNVVVQPVPAPEVMKQDIERSRSLEEQFKRNGNK